MSHRRPRLQVLPPDRRPVPRRYARIPSPERIRAWTEAAVAALDDPLEAVGRHPVLLWSVLEYLASNPGLEPEDLELRVNRDKLWRERPIRTPAERLSYRGHILWDSYTRHMTVVWIMARPEVVEKLCGEGA